MGFSIRTRRRATLAVNDEKDLADDLMMGGEALAEFMFGNKEERRKVYHLAESKNPPPFFKMGSVICARKSTLLRWIAEQERARA
jgi:hypothetical protein